VAGRRSLESQKGRRYDDDASTGEGNASLAASLEFGPGEKRLYAHITSDAALNGTTDSLAADLWTSDEDHNFIILYNFSRDGILSPLRPSTHASGNMSLVELKFTNEENSPNIIPWVPFNFRWDYNVGDGTSGNNITAELWVFDIDKRRAHYGG
jgi:hypothetical protein